MQQFEVAETHLKKGLDLAHRANQPNLTASLLNSLGNLSVSQQDNVTAWTHYEQAQKLATDAESLLKILINQTHLQLKQGEWSHAESLLQTVVTEIKKPPEKSASQWLSVGQLALRLLSRQPSAERLTVTYQVLEQALQLAVLQKNQRLIASAKGYLGHVYEHAQRYPEALQLTQEAIFLSQERIDLLYRWEWQQGRILQKQGNLTAAITVYQQALERLKSIRPQLIKGYVESSEFFNEFIRPVYFGLVDILLQQAKVTTEPSQKTQLLLRARNTAESLKIAELQDYFQSECLPEKHSETKAIDTLDVHTAILYPILLPDRIELLVSFANEIQQQVIPVELELLKETVMQFQKNLQAKTHYRFVNQARQLYQWLIVPLVDSLKQKKIETLVIIPDSFLRMIPMAALFDDQRKEYLIEQFALAVTPSLNLTEPRPLPKENIVMLLSGLSEGVQNFSPLPNVLEEVDLLKTLFSEKNILLDQQFLMTVVAQTLKEKPYSMVVMN